MGLLDAEIDANFFNLVHQLAMSDAKRGTERRGADRHQFVSMQRIAFRRGAGIPEEADFFDVQCHDLNTGGFSFLVSKPPTFKFLVAAFGEPPNVIYVSARVAHTADVLVDDAGHVVTVEEADEHGPAGQRARPMCLVGCSFVERLKREDDQRETVDMAGAAGGSG